MEVLGEGEAEKTKYVNVMREKTTFFFENYHGFNSICAKHAIFATGMSCEKVAKIP